ncbi:MAG: hypothetical protein PHO79_06645 [Desulfoplanes sp.]|jgi:type I restriction enzyme S subunit|nr:hypothetical protein [Desulfoplanes sp.]MDD4649675.1 hypothetical protein [Desulfoplanes sp.]
MANDIESLNFKKQELELLYSQKLIALAELKQSILQKAFAGELTADYRSEVIIPQLSQQI